MRTTGLLATAVSAAVTLAMAVAQGAGAADVQRGAGLEVCRAKALGQLERLDPPGFTVYVAMRRKSDFLTWITCDDLQLDLATAVHESVHVLTEERDAYPLIGGGALPRLPAGLELAPPSIAAHRFDRQDIFVETYLLPGKASSSEDVRYLLDELNAYTHDLSAAVALASLAPGDREASHRDGLAALMAFLHGYLEEVRTHHPETWKTLAQGAPRRTISVLWSEAERVMGRSCRLAGFGTAAPGFLGPVCSSTSKGATSKGALGVLLGRPPACPVTCLRPELAHSARR